VATSPTTFTGNLTADPNLSYTGNGTAKLAFAVAVNHVWRDAEGEQQKKVSYFDCVAWRQTAENAADVLEKGIGVIVTGRLEQRSWEDKETGQKRSKVELVVDDIGVSARSIQGVTRRESSGGEGAAKAGGGNRRPVQKQSVPDIDEEAF